MNAPIAPPTDATVLVIASGKGGTGVSLTAALLGLTVAGEGRQVLLVDGTESYGALHLMLGVTPRHPLAALRGGDTQAEELLAPVAETLALFPGGGDDGAAVAPLSAAERQLLFRRVAELYARYDLVVVDAGSRLEAVLTACDGGVTRLLLVTSDDPITMAAMHALLKAVEARRPGLPVEVLVNRAGVAEAERIAAQLRDAAARFLGRTLDFAGALPDDPCLQGGLGAGMTVQDAAAGSPAALAAREAGLRLLNDDGALVGAGGSAARSHARHA
ncbi:MAG TPA: cellulose synthase operon protein YhjQ/BcsQ [Gemmatimonadaceae bacterium]|nr:cellulose synthase operon protein YhjQ/BcsQ [Gemmatimonadaceae bacterium]